MRGGKGYARVDDGLWRRKRQVNEVPKEIRVYVTSCIMVAEVARFNSFHHMILVLFDSIPSLIQNLYNNFKTISAINWEESSAQ